MQMNVGGMGENKRTLLNIPMKQIKNKKLTQKLKRLLDFFKVTTSYLELMNFKITVTYNFEEDRVNRLINTILGGVDQNLSILTQFGN